MAFYAGFDLYANVVVLVEFDAMRWEYISIYVFYKYFHMERIGEIREYFCCNGIELLFSFLIQRIQSDYKTVTDLLGTALRDLVSVTLFIAFFNWLAKMKKLRDIIVLDMCTNSHYKKEQKLIWGFSTKIQANNIAKIFLTFLIYI